MNIDFNPSEVQAYYFQFFSESWGSQKREYRTKCPVHKGTNNNFVIDSESGLCYCFSKCGRGWDMIGLDQELFGGDFVTARRRVFALVGRYWDEPTTAELKRLAGQQRQDREDEAMAVCWRHAVLRLIERQLAEDKAHLFVDDELTCANADKLVRQNTARESLLVNCSRLEMIAEFRAERAKSAWITNYLVREGAEDLEDCRVVCVAIVRALELSVSQFPNLGVE